VTITHDLTPPATGLLDEASCQPGRLIDLIDDTVDLYRVRPGTKYHLNVYCSSLKAWQQAPASTRVAFSTLEPSALCKQCASLSLLNTLKLWSQCPADLSGEQMVLACSTTPRSHFMPTAMSQLILQCAAALGAQVSQDGFEKKRFAAVVSAPLVKWLGRWAPPGSLSCISRAGPTDTPAVLALAVALWEPWSESLLNDPTQALESARLILAPQAP
jgi:hypothetical protein